jgi:hypothetical protein
MHPSLGAVLDHVEQAWGVSSVGLLRRKFARVLILEDEPTKYSFERAGDGSQ